MRGTLPIAPSERCSIEHLGKHFVITATLFCTTSGLLGRGSWLKLSTGKRFGPPPLNAASQLFLQGHFWPSVISTVTGGLLVGLVLEAQPLGRTTLQTKMLVYTASPTSAVKVDGRILYRYFLAVDGAVATRLDSQLMIVKTEETKQWKDDK